MAPQGRKLDEATKYEISRHLRAGKSQREAARAAGVARSTVYKVTKRT